MNRQLILHMGFHKTGTTSIQKACRINAQRLGEAGIYYPEFVFEGVQYNRNHSIPVYSMFSERPEEFPRNLLIGHDVIAANTCFRQQLEQALHCSESRLVLSGEAISLLSAVELTSLKQFVEAAGWEVRAVVYLRRPATFFSSWFAQRSRLGDDPAKTNEAQKIIERVSAVRSVFPAVEFYSFEQVCEQHGSSVRHFFRLLDLPDELADAADWLNRSPSTQAVRLMQSISAEYPSIVRGKKSPYRNRNDTAPLLKVSGEKFRFNQGELVEVLPQIEQLNGWLLENLGPEFCDTDGVPEPGDCAWSDRQLDELAGALPGLPEHFLQPIQHYLTAEAGLTDEQRVRVEQMIAEASAPERLCRNVLSAHARTLRKLAAALEPHDPPRARNLMQLASLGRPGAIDVAHQLTGLDRRLASAEATSVACDPKIYREVLGEHTGTLRELAGELEPLAPTLASELAQLADRGRRRGALLRNLLATLTNRRGRAEPVPKLYLHIGLPKTGTTYLQNCFEWFEKQSQFSCVSYPLLATHESFLTIHSGNGVEVGHYLSPRLNPEFRLEVLHEKIDRLLQRVQDPDRSVLVSSEFFSTAPADRAGAMTDYFARLGYEVEIIVIGRPLVEQLFSAYMQCVKRDAVARPFDAWVGDVARRLPASYIQNVAAYMPPVHVLPFDRTTLLPRVLELIGEDAALWQLAETATVNRSLTRGELNLLVEVNRVYDDPRLATRISNRLIADHPERQSAPITDAELAATRAAIAAIEPPLASYREPVEAALVETFLAEPHVLSSADPAVEPDAHVDPDSLRIALEVIGEYTGGADHVDSAGAAAAPLDKDAARQLEALCKPHVDAFRELAIAIEDIDPRISRDFMQFAQHGRPNGEVINRRLQRYRREIPALPAADTGPAAAAIEKIRPHADFLRQFSKALEASFPEHAGVLSGYVEICGA
ncbi:hypothetical protein E4634_19015 [Mangrovimicrobium sediminis]|uniref:Sulfotransferase family protein n=1 Tax=Mangrovimicrobium sediminis TaxID=2562682 RepID=A0A4Z0LVD9_9GAMM|nr:hypothetical protein [Haliea sp. SAOS-164]TGD71363.1 hypothetical protein E4634_19015 [Haliea sp. SAOS-164]